MCVARVKREASMNLAYDILLFHSGKHCLENSIPVLIRVDDLGVITS
jgi:hypothetical protein